jgi:hypothetical protein
MKSVQHQISELSTAAIVSGKFSADQIAEVTGQGSPEQQLSKLQQMTEGHNLSITTADDHYARQIAKLTEQLAKSGKVQGFQIVEALESGANQRERFEALQSLARAKKIGVDKIVRNNGGRADVFESAGGRPSDDERVQAAMKKHKCSFREAHVMCGLPDPGPNMTESVSAVTDRAKRWMRYSPTISEADAMSMALKGIEPR